MLHIPEGATVVVLTPPVTTNGGVTTDYISLKNVQKCTLVAIATQAVSHASLLSPTQASAVDGTGVKALTNILPIWANTNITLTSVLTRQTDAVAQALLAGATNQILLMAIDPAGLDHANGFDCLGCTVSDSSQATNFITIFAILETRYSNLDALVD